MKGTMMEELCGAVRPAFRTHNGVIITQERFLAACKVVANDLRENAQAVYKEDAYAAHVTEQEKKDAMLKGFVRAYEVECGKVDNFTIWQRVNEVLTGECVAL